jgi:hypothetical protein
MTNHFHAVIAFLCVLGILALPAAASAAYWAFFSHQTKLGFILFFAAQIPLIVQASMDWARA